MHPESGLENSMIRIVSGNSVSTPNPKTVKAGWFYDYDIPASVAQLCVWDGATLALEGVKTWYWTGSTNIRSVAVEDVDGDGAVEIVTGGYHFDESRHNAQLCVWGYS